MCSIYLICLPCKTSLPLVFINGMFFATLLEYITGYIMEKLFHAKWWDYSRFKYNLHGYICLHIALAWGILTLLFIEIIHPLIAYLVTLLPLPLSYVLLSGLIVVFLIDVIYSTYTAFKLTARFPALSELRLEMIALLEQSKLYEAAEELKVHFEFKKVSSKLTTIIESLKEHLPQNTELSKVQLHELLIAKLNKYHAQLDKFSSAEKRLLKAFPSLSLTSIKSIKDRFINRGEHK